MNHNSDNLRKATTYFYYSQTTIEIGKKTRYVIYNMRKCGQHDRLGLRLFFVEKFYLNTPRS